MSIYSSKPLGTIHTPLGGDASRTTCGLEQILLSVALLAFLVFFLFLLTALAIAAVRTAKVKAAHSRALARNTRTNWTVA